MAITAPTKLSDFSGFITREQAGRIFDEARKQSVIQRLVKSTNLPFNGKSFPVVTGKPAVAWVSEGARKPASAGGMTLQTMDPKKMAAIVVTSSEVVRANPGGYVTELRDDLAEAFAGAFDKAAAYDQGPDGTPGGGPFPTYLNQTTKAVELGTGDTVHDDFNSMLKLLVNDGKRLTGFALDDRAEPTLWGAKDANDRPLYVELSDNTNTVPEPGVTRAGRILNRPAWMGDGMYSGDTDKIVGFAGNWSKATWGVVGGISYKLSDIAAVTIDGELTSLFEHNLVAIRAEAEYGFLVNDPESFVRITDDSAAE
jgi:HK97 family phage major capsid protein